MKDNKFNLKMENISIEFPGVKALSDVDFEMESGKIRALIGANGAGKSTLMKVLVGVNNHYTGRILIDGNEISMKTPKDAKKQGIEIVYQEVDTALVSYLTVGENIMLSNIVNNMGKKQIVNWKKIFKSATEALEKLNFNIDVKLNVSELTLAQKQMVLIARAVSEKCRLLVLDEPTAPLSNSETKELFRVVKSLAKNDNIGIIFISHRIPELIEICESITIMRDGKIVTEMPIDENISSKQIVELMLGRKIDETFPKKKVEIGDLAFEVKNLYDKAGTVKNASINVRKGEIVGISGLVGAGKTELCKNIFGAFKILSGEIILNGKNLNIKNPHDAVGYGIALVPEERRKEGVLVSEPVYSNLSLTSLKSFTGFMDFLNFAAEKISAKKIIESLDIKTPSENQQVSLLSGGNQQKVAVGKWIVSDAEVYIFDEPTKGVDVGAKHDIFQLIGRLVEAGKSVIYASCEFSEILSVTDRTYVMYDGMIQKELVTKDTNEKEVLYYSTGGE
jgi:simple sugar transport system ATP-binding protein